LALLELLVLLELELTPQLVVLVVLALFQSPLISKEQPCNDMQLLKTVLF
jgi:hypothetical protein